MNELGSGKTIDEGRKFLVRIVTIVDYHYDDNQKQGQIV